MLFWQVYPKIQPDPLISYIWLLGGAIMEIFPKFSYFANRHRLCLYYLQCWVNLLIFTEIGLGQGETTLILSEKRGLTLFQNHQYCMMDLGYCSNLFWSFW